jgi:hypothetical protein
MIPSGKGGSLMSQVTADHLATGLAASHVPAAHVAAGHLAAGLAVAGHPGPGAPAAGRVALVAVAILAVGAFTVLQIRAWSDHRSARRARPDWRVPPSRYGQDAGQDETPGGNEKRNRPDWQYGYPPGYEPGPRERGPAS